MNEPDPQQEPEVLSPEDGEPEISLMDRIDGLAAFLGDFAKREETTPAIRVKIFGELVAWQKVKAVLDPKGLEGNRLKEFHNELKSGQGSGTGSRRIPLRAAGPRKQASDTSGAEIRKLIRSLPSPAQPGNHRGGSEDPERAGQRDRGADGVGGADVSGYGKGDGDGAGDSRVV